MKTRAAQAGPSTAYSAPPRAVGSPPSPTLADSSPLSDIDGVVDDWSGASAAATVDLELEALAEEGPPEAASSAVGDPPKKKAGGGSKGKARARAPLTGEKLETQRAKNRIKQANYRARITNTIATLRAEKDNLTTRVGALLDRVDELERELAQERALGSRAGEGGPDESARPGKRVKINETPHAPVPLSGARTMPPPNASAAAALDQQLPTPDTPAHASFGPPSRILTITGLSRRHSVPLPTETRPRDLSHAPSSSSSSSTAAVKREPHQRPVNKLRPISEGIAVPASTFPSWPAHDVSYNAPMFQSRPSYGGTVRSSPAAYKVSSVESRTTPSGPSPAAMDPPRHVLPAATTFDDGGSRSRADWLPPMFSPPQPHHQSFLGLHFSGACPSSSGSHGEPFPAVGLSQSAVYPTPPVETFSLPRPAALDQRPSGGAVLHSAMSDATSSYYTVDDDGGVDDGQEDEGSMEWGLVRTAVDERKPSPEELALAAGQHDGLVLDWGLGDGPHGQYGLHGDSP